MLLPGERAGSEAYAPDEVAALSQFAHGVGSALDVVSTDGRSRTEPYHETLELILDELRALRFSTQPNPGTPR